MVSWGSFPAVGTNKLMLSSSSLIDKVVVDRKYKAKKPTANRKREEF
jgi:hypothetical protein